MDNSLTVLDTLREWQIPFEYYEHDPAPTIDACVKMPFITPEVVICKNIFLCNRQKTQFYLMLLKPEKAFSTATVSKELGVSRLSFAPESLLPELLGLQAGAVSPLGLLFDKKRQVSLVCDRQIAEYPRIAVHPCVNTATVVFEAEDFWKGVLRRMNIAPQWVLSIDPLPAADKAVL